VGDYVGFELLIRWNWHEPRSAKSLLGLNLAISKARIVLLSDSACESYASEQPTCWSLLDGVWLVRAVIRYSIKVNLGSRPNFIKRGLLEMDHKFPTKFSRKKAV
jgi:hypothetical protein